MKPSLTAAVLFLCVPGCKDRSVAASADASIAANADAGTAASVTPKKATADAGAGTPALAEKVVWVEALAVSSRVENDTEEPAFLVDGDLGTAWSSKTGELEGAWVQLRLKSQGARAIHGIAMTVGLTKRAAKKDDDDDGSPSSAPKDGGDLFVQNPRIAEVSVAWNDTVLVESFKLDPESRELQTIAFPSEAKGDGVLRLTVKKVKAGTKPAYREVSISELELLAADRTRLGIKPTGAYVGSLDPKPRGLLDMVPEKPAPMRCLAFLPGAAPRAYCVLGYTAHVGPSRLNGGELVVVDKSGSKTIAPLVEHGKDSFLYRLPYGQWLRVERELKAGRGRPLLETASDVKTIPWEGSVEVNGATFRQRETAREPKDGGDTFDLINGVLEVKWPGETAFTSIFRESPNLPPTERMVATIRPIEGLFLVERRMVHGSEATNAEGAEASFCDFAAKKCTTYAVPSPEAKDD